MATIQTALGPIADSDLGFTLSHEHVMTSAGSDNRFYPWMIDWVRTRENAIAHLKQAKAEGVDSFIDLTGVNHGRHVRYIADVSRASGVQIVVASGVYVHVPPSFIGRDIDAIADIFVHEIEVGIEDTDIRAGVMKLATDVEMGITPEYEKIIRAAGRASNRTGCPISTHHWAPSEAGLEQVRILREEGVQMDRVCIGHCAESTKTSYHEELLNSGVFISMDRYPGRPPRVGWEARNESVKALVDRGWAHRIMMGHDHSAGRPVRPGQTEAPEAVPGYNPDGLLFLTRVGIPKLLESGVSQDAIDTMMCEAPRRFLSGED